MARMGQGEGGQGSVHGVAAVAEDVRQRQGQAGDEGVGAPWHELPLPGIFFGSGVSGPTHPPPGAHGGGGGSWEHTFWGSNLGPKILVLKNK